MSRRLSTGLLVVALLAPLAAQSKPDPSINARIREEENSHSQIMKTLHMLADVYGPRVTGSPSLKAAGEWAIKEMASWGFSNGHLEPWDFGHPGWVNERFSAHITAPVKDQLTCEVLAWTPGTDGTVAAAAYQLHMPDRPTPETLTAFLESEKTKVKGRIVLVGKHTIVPVHINPPAKRRSDEEVRAQYEPENPHGGRGRGEGTDPGDDLPGPFVGVTPVDLLLDGAVERRVAGVEADDAPFG